jgi:hypothetical protein
MNQKAGGTIYALGLQGTPYVKIGSTTTTVQQRRKQLQVGQPFFLEILAAVPVEEHLLKLERQVQLFLAETKVRGECFKVTIDGVILADLVRLAAHALRASDPPAPMATTIGAYLALHPQEDLWYDGEAKRFRYMREGPAPALPDPLPRHAVRVCRRLSRHGDMLVSRLHHAVRPYGIGGAECTAILQWLAAKDVVRVYTRPGPVPERRVAWIGDDEAANWGPPLDPRQKPAPADDAQEAEA